MMQAPSKVLIVFLLHSRCLALVPMERLPFFLLLSGTNGDKSIWTGSAAIILAIRTGSICLK